jgi:hypothetical protein
LMNGENFSSVWRFNAATTVHLPAIY